jgi:hypothetical protein
MIDEGWRCFVGVPIGQPLDRDLRGALGALQAAASRMSCAGSNRRNGT